MISERQIAKYFHDKGLFKDAHVFIRDFEQVDESLLVDIRVEEFGYNLMMSKTILVKDLEKYDR